MSLTQFINNSPIFQEFIRTIIPTRSDFYTLSGKTPFSKDYIYLAPNNGLTSVKSSISGTAFDYIARLTIAQTNPGKYSSIVCQDLVAQRGLQILSRKIPSKASKRFDRKYCKAIDAIKKFIRKEVDSLYIADYLVYLAKLELVYRSGGLIPQEGVESILVSESEIIEDLICLHSVFEDNFIAQNISCHSSVIFNPHFGKYSNLIGGADADIIIDNTLYDFKTIVSKGYSWKHTAQLVSYFFMNILNCSMANNMSTDLKLQNVRYLALYQARYGEICFFDTEKFGDKLKIYTNEFKEFFEKLENDKAFFVECFLPKPKSSISVSGDDIKKFRADNHLSQEQFGLLMGVNKKTVRFWELGYSLPSYENQKRISEVINIKN